MYAWSDGLCLLRIDKTAALGTAACERERPRCDGRVARSMPTIIAPDSSSLQLSMMLMVLVVSLCSLEFGYVGVLIFQRGRNQEQDHC